MAFCGISELGYRENLAIPLYSKNRAMRKKEAGGSRNLLIDSELGIRGGTFCITV